MSLYQKDDLLLEGEGEQEIAMEFGFARHSNHPFLNHCLHHHVKVMRKFTLIATGPKMLRNCYLDFFNVSSVPWMRTLQRARVLKPSLVAPMRTDDHKSACGKLRKKKDPFWEQEFLDSRCFRELRDNGSFAFTIYSGSWYPWEAV